MLNCADFRGIHDISAHGVSRVHCTSWHGNAFTVQQKKRKKKTKNTCSCTPNTLAHSTGTLRFMHACTYLQLPAPSQHQRQDTIFVRITVAVISILCTLYNTITLQCRPTVATWATQWASLRRKYHDFDRFCDWTMEDISAVYM